MKGYKQRRQDLEYLIIFISTGVLGINLIILPFSWIAAIIIGSLAIFTVIAITIETYTWK